MADQQYTEQSQATTALVLGVVGVVICWFLGPVAWWMGQREVKAIDAGRRPPESRGSARAGQILGIIGTVLLILAVPGGVIVAQNLDEIVSGLEEGLTGTSRNEDGDILETGTLSVYDLEIGDCGDWPDEDLYLSVTVHPCVNSHDFEVYLVLDMPGGANAVYPGDTAVFGFADQACLDAFEDYVGVSWEESPDLTYTYIHPNSESWEEGDREVTCTITHVTAGTKLIGSKLGTS